MQMDLMRSRFGFLRVWVRLGCCAALALGMAFPAHGQQPAAAEQTPVAQATAPEKALAGQATEKAAPEAGRITEAELKQLLVGKALYLRGSYLDNTLSFDEHGRLIGHAAQGSYTLCAIEIDKVRLTRHKVVLEGARYGLHFLGQLAVEDQASAFDRVKITPKKKLVKITIDREMVVKAKKVKAAGKVKGKTPAATEPAEPSEAEQLKASIAATPEAERPADPNSVTTTTSPAHARRMLRDSIDSVFAQGMDERMIAAMPDFWKLYYQAVADKADYRPKDAAVLRQSAVDQKAALLTKFEPESNEFAQAKGVAGMALYHTVVGTDGKAGEIAVGRPIGFGLDENAVEAIRKASFQPAVKDGKPVVVLLDLVVQFRIFDKRTDVAKPPEAADKPAEPVLPGPYSLPPQQ